MTKRNKSKSSTQKGERQKEDINVQYSQKMKEEQKKDTEEIQKTKASTSNEQVPTDVIGDRKLLRQLEKQKREDEELAERQKNAGKNAKRTEKDKQKKPATKTENITIDRRSISSDRKSRESDVLYAQCASEVPSARKINSQVPDIDVSSFSRESKSDEKRIYTEQARYVPPSLRKEKIEEASTSRSKSDQVAFTSQDYRSKEFEKLNISNNFNSSTSQSAADQVSHPSQDWRKKENNRGSYNADNNFKRPDRHHSSYDDSVYGRNSSKNYDNYSRRSDTDYNKSGYGGNDDKEFRKFTFLLKKNGIDFGKVQEIVGDLFDAPTEYALAHCVAEDMSMGAGIAVQFRTTFRGIADLLDQRVRTGGVAVLHKKGRFIYYLVTKNRSQGKPVLYTLWLSLLEMREHMLKNEVTKLAIPQIGCGLDRLDWSDVKQMLEYIFQDDKIEIVVYSLQDNYDSKPKSKAKARVVHAMHPLLDIATGTGLLYLGTEDGFISDEIRSLESKYIDLGTIYSRNKKSVGDVIRSEIRNEVLYGLIVKRSNKDQLKYVDLERCLIKLKQLLKKDDFYYVGLQAFPDEDGVSCLVLEKIITVLQDILFTYEIHICWPSELTKYAPIIQTPSY